ncbi:alpha/beta hydrolase [Desulfobacterota bacterium AH_259_B03_O07]|nr:alpha/beta hydrolase [Desulfobacterota bacterium AH_259_B03_O07]
MMIETKIHEKQSLVRLRASDGFLVSSVLVTQDYKQIEAVLEIPTVVQIHGLLGHFLARGTPRLLPHALLEQGFNSLSINSRLAYAGQITGKGIFDDSINDIDAAVDFLINEGFKNIFILGYSLGASMVVYWASKRNNPLIKGLILEGVHYSTNEAHRMRLQKWSGTPTYEEIYEKAKMILGDDPYNSKNDETFIIYKSRGPTPEPINNDPFTYKTWWFMMGPHADAAKAFKHIEKINIPILFMRGENDYNVQQWEIDELVKLAVTAGNNEIRSIQIPDARHDCMENPEVMLNEVASFINDYS